MRWLRRVLHGTYEPPREPPIAVRRVELTAAEVEVGRRSWLRLNPETGLLESIMYFDGRPPSYAAVLPRRLSLELEAFLVDAVETLAPLIEEDLAPTQSKGSRP